MQHIAIPLVTLASSIQKTEHITNTVAKTVKVNDAVPRLNAVEPSLTSRQFETIAFLHAFFVKSEQR